MLSRRNAEAKELRERRVSKKEAIDRMLADPNLIRRPLVLSKKKAVFGYDPEGFETL